MNLLDLSVSITVDSGEAKQQMESAVDAMIDETERAEGAFSNMSTGINDIFSKIADEGFFSSFSDLLDDAGKMLDFGTIISTGLSWIGLGLMATAEGAKEAADQFSEYRDGLVLTNGPIESMENNLALLRDRYAELMKLQEESGGYGFNMKELDAVDYAIEAQEIALVEAAILNLGLAYEVARDQVSRWFGLFEKAEQIQTASLDEMAANIQSQIDYNREYQESLETLTDAGYGDLAVQMQELGKSGAGYLKAFADAVSTGDTEAINSIQTLMKELSTSQDSLAKTITDTSGAFDTLIKAIETATGEPFQVVLEDNAAEVAEGVNASLDKIADVTVKYIDIVTRYTEQGNPNAAPNSSNAQGLEYVPFDNYIISAHRGEALLTADEAKEWRSGGKSSAPDPNVARILNVLEHIASQGLSANISSRSLYKMVSSENRVRSKATGYNGLSMT